VNREELAFEQPRDLFAATPPELEAGARDEVRLLVTTPTGHRHARFADLPRLLDSGDLLVVNESATLPASLVAHNGAGPFVLNLSTRYGERLWLAEPRVDPAHPGPMPIEAGEEARAGEATVRFVAPYPGIPRLWFIHADRPLEPVLAKEGSPIHYGYVEHPWPLESYQSLFSRVPGSAEMPSAARPVTPRIRRALEDAGIRFASVLLHSGVSSLEIEAPTVEEQAVYPEPFEVSSAAADLANRARAEGRRVVAVGTTVVRALESAWTPDGVTPRRGFTRLFVNSDHPVRAVDGLLTGFHDPVTSHLAMLSAFIGVDRVKEAYEEAIENRYRWHEFGDSHLILRN
jgi:S-adenosylmethionine:tRNA ribosyltransferase-isomerase